MMNKFIFILMLGILLQAGLASATIDFNPLEKSYSPGDHVNLGGIFTNNYTEKKSMEIEQSLIHEGQVPTIGMSNNTIEPGRIAVIRGLGFTVQGTTDSGVYTYMVTVYEEGNPIESARISFEIIGTNKRFEDIRLKTCTSPDCRVFNSVFVVDKTAYIKVLDSEAASFTGYVEDDFGFRKDLHFEGDVAGFKLEKTGYFRVRVIAEKYAYESHEMELKFFVIESNYVLTDFFPVFRWLYYFVVILVVGAVVILIVATLSSKKRRDRLGEWLMWRRWKRKREEGSGWGYILKLRKDLKGERG